MRAMDTAKATTLYARAKPGFDERVERAVGLLVRNAERHRGRIVQATSLGAEDMVVTDLIARLRPADRRRARSRPASSTPRRST